MSFAACPVNFEFLNYTIITSQCKGPLYLPSLCCPAFKEFACPYVDYLNDLSNDCATIMFSYINLYGKYPPGLFSSECREGKLGLACNATSPSLSATATGNETIPGSSLMLALLTMGFLLLLLWNFWRLVHYLLFAIFCAFLALSGLLPLNRVLAIIC